MGDLINDGTPIQVAATLESITCCNCGVLFAVPAYLRKKLLETHNTFYCPNGHGQSYRGKAEAERLKEQITEKEIKLANALNGKCPHCWKTVKNLQAHIKRMH